MSAKKIKKLIPETNSSKPSKKKALKKTAKQNSGKTTGGVANLKPFPKGKSGNPKGRPRKLVNTIIEAMKSQGVKPLKQAQIADAYEVLLQLTETEMKKLVLDKSTPMFIRIICKAMMDKNGTQMIETMLDRAHGRAKQSLDVKAEVDDGLDYSKFTDGALKEIIAQRKQS